MKTSFFDVGNANNRGCFILALDKDDAAKIALQIGHVKSIKAARVHGPQDISNDSNSADLIAYMEAGRRGKLHKRIQARTFDQIFGRQPQPKPLAIPAWSFAKEIT
jgi:hypothetical protein